MGLLNNFLAGVNGVLDALEDPDGSKEKEAQEANERRRIAAEKDRCRERYCKETWVCPKCGNTNYGGQRCRECRNGNPNIPSNLR